uniref:Uncharacterized protein n=1 Tax=Oryza barthii TaxID=65489 RepID=A0A0D3GUB2_9ORYZ
MASSTSEARVELCLLSPMLPENMLKLSSSDVDLTTLLSSFSSSMLLKKGTSSASPLIMAMASSMTNLLILGTFTLGVLCSFRISTSLLAMSVSGVASLVICIANPIDTSSKLLFSTIIALNTCEIM